MNHRAIAIAVALVATGLATLLWWTSRPGPGHGQHPKTAPSAAPATTGPGERPVPREVPEHADASIEDSHAHAAVEREAELPPAEDPTGDLDLYGRRPMSPVPHQVVRGWGAHGAGSVPGFVGAVVVVDPSISDEQLVRLARDIRAYHDDARALSVRILDSERAGLYDRHSDGGALLARHLVGLVNRNARLGMDRIVVRGRELEP